MSYILDALRRADAERQRGSVPGLNTPGSTWSASAEPAPAARNPQRLALGGVAVLAVVALGVGGWLALRGGTHTSEMAAAAPAATPAPQALGAAPTAAPAAQPAVQPVVVAAPAPTPPTPPVVVVMPAPAPVAAAPAAAPVPVPPAPMPAPVAPAATVAAAPTPARVPTLAELPEPVRRQVPALALGGSMYSEQAAQRLVIVNGQVAREGDEAAPGVRVLQIRPKAVVFSVGGQRFEMPL